MLFPTIMLLIRLITLNGLQFAVEGRVKNMLMFIKQSQTGIDCLMVLPGR